MSCRIISASSLPFLHKYIYVFPPLPFYLFFPFRYLFYTSVLFPDISAYVCILPILSPFSLSSSCYRSTGTFPSSGVCILSSFVLFPLSFLLFSVFFSPFLCLFPLHYVPTRRVRYRYLFLLFSLVRYLLLTLPLTLFTLLFPLLFLL